MAKVAEKEFEENNEIAQMAAAPKHAFQNMDIGTAHFGRLDEKEATINTSGVEDLPDDVKQNLSGYDSMQLSELLLKCLAAFPHPINTDRIIITLWVSHRHKEERTKVIRHLRALSSMGSVIKQEGTRGMYSLTDQGRKLAGG